MELNTGTLGAKVQSWEKNNARELLARLVTNNPSLDDEALFHIFAAECAPYFHEIVRYWVANNLRALRPRTRASGSSVDRTADRAAAVEAVKAEAKARATKLVLLDFVLPNGKMLRDCTFAECAKAGGWLTKLANKGQPNEKVGAVLSEKEIKAVWNA